MSERKIGFRAIVKSGSAPPPRLRPLFSPSSMSTSRPSGKDVSGTIVPAQRYRAAQPTAEDVKLGGQSTPATSTDAAGSA